ncbi:Clu domain-containing protein (Fragment), variant 2 [Balamuthia mandrillaris]
MGFRLIAISVLPIGGDTLLYGSADGGETIHKDNRDLNKKMKLAAKKMNLKGHSVGLKEYDVKKLYAPVDIEGHLGRDGRFYVLDYARTFPPEKPSLERRTRKGIILYNLLRPELVRQNPVPLSPDAFTVWSRIDPNKVEHNREVLEATERLLNQVIPALAKQLNRLTHHNNEEDEEGENNETSRQYQERRPSWDEKEEDIVRRIDVIEQAHMTGVNVRHLGRLRRLVQSKLLQQKILIEMIARVVRKQSQALLRDAIRHSGVPSEGPARQAMASLFNMVLGKGDAGSSENKTTYWTKKLKEQLLYQYEQALFDIEMEEGYDLREGLDMLDLIERIAQLTSIRFTEQARRDMEKTIRSGQNFKFVFCDFEGLSSHVKHMNLIDVADGTSMFYDSLKEKGSNQVRMLTMALTKFQEASRKMPFNPDIITNLGDLLVQHAEQQVLRGEMDAAEQSFENALMAFKTALSIRPGYSRCVVGMGNIYLAQQKIEEAIFRYEEALALEPEGSAEAHLQLGRIAYKLGHNIDYEKASHHFQKAAELNADLHIAALLAANSQFLSLLQNVEKDDFVLVTNSTPASSTIEQEVYEIAAKYEKSLALSDSASESLVGSAVKKSNLYLLLLFHVATYSDRLKEVLKRELASITTLSFETMLSGGDEAIRLGRSTYLCEHLLELLPLCSSLRELALPTCGTLTDLHVAQIVTIFASSGLETLNVRNCTQLTDESLQKIASEAGWSKHLQCLYFDGCTNLSSSALEDTITKSCPNLRSISLQNVSSVQDSLVQSLLNYCTQLEELDFRNCSALTQNAFISASSAASSSGEGAENTNAECNTSSYSVKILRLEGQSGFTHETLIAILDKMPALEELGLRNVQTLDDATLLPMMSRRCPSLKLLVAPSGTPFTYSGKDGLQVQMREMTQTAYFIDLKTSKNILQVSHRSFFRTVDGTDIRINHPRPGFITLTDGNSATLASFTKEQFSGQWVCKLLDGSISRFRFDSLTKRLTFTPNEAISIQSLLAGYHRIVIKPGMNATLALLTTYVALEAK